MVVHINDTFRNRWWGLFTYYDVKDLPRINNDLERCMRRIKIGEAYGVCGGESAARAGWAAL